MPNRIGFDPLTTSFRFAGLYESGRRDRRLWSPSPACWRPRSTEAPLRTEPVGYVLEPGAEGTLLVKEIGGAP